MSKYELLWNWIAENGTDSFKLTYAEIEKIAGLPIDHSFLTYKKELLEYGFVVGKISMKEQTVTFEKINEQEMLLIIFLLLFVDIILIIILIKDITMYIPIARSLITLVKTFRHKTLEERAAEFDGKLMLDGEYDWG